MAARSFRLIAVSPSTIEGIGFGRGEPSFGDVMSRFLPPPEESDPLVHLLQQVEEQLDASSWSGSPVTLIFPSHEVTVRRLDFPFKDPKKVEQALVFELENELLEDVGDFIHNHTILPRADGSAYVLVYLASGDYVRAMLNLLQDRQLTPVKATFSAQVLHEVHPAPPGRHYQIYLGLDEMFVSCILDQRLHTVKSFPLSLAGLKGTLAGLNGGGGAAALQPAQVFGLLGSSNGTGEESLGAPRMAWNSSLVNLGGEMTRFIRPHSMGQPITVSVHGLLAPFFHWDDGQGALAVQSPPEGERAFARKTFMGILEEVLAGSNLLRSHRGVNFIKRHSKLLPQLREHRRPLIVAAVLLFLSLGLVGFNYFQHVGQQRAELARIDDEISSTLRRNLRGNHPPATGVRLLTDQLQKMRVERAATSQFSNYHYDRMNLLLDLTELFKLSPGLKLGSVSINSERFAMAGTTESYQASEEFKNRLAALAQFGGKEPVITHQRRGKDITYRIAIDL